MTRQTLYGGWISKEAREKQQQTRKAFEADPQYIKSRENMSRLGKARRANPEWKAMALAGLYAAYAERGEEILKKQNEANNHLDSLFKRGKRAQAKMNKKKKEVEDGDATVWDPASGKLGVLRFKASALNKVPLAATLPRNELLYHLKSALWMVVIEIPEGLDKPLDSPERPWNKLKPSNDGPEKHGRDSMACNTKAEKRMIGVCLQGWRK